MTRAFDPNPSRRPRLLVTRRLPEAVEERLAARFEVSLNAQDRVLQPRELAEAMTSFDALCPTITDKLDAGILNAAGRSVRMIANFGAGTEHIDLPSARANGIQVSNTPDALSAATAELAILLMLMTARRAGEGERQLRAGKWPGWAPTHLMGTSLAGKTLGLVGFGRIAQATGALAVAHGMKIIYHSRSAAAAAAARRMAASRAACLEDLLARADIISLHVPGGPVTRHMIDAPRLALMSPSAILINTARGTLIDEEALIEALRSGRLRAAGLDVFENEPHVHPELASLENVVLLPHLGSAALETRVAMGMQAAANLEAFFLGREVPNRVA